MSTHDIASMPKGWVERSLGEIVEFQRGFDLPTNDRKVWIYPLVVSNGVDGFVNEYKVKGPWVVTGRSWTLWKVLFIKEDFWPLNTTLWIKDFKWNNEKFIYYWLLTFPFEKFNAGSGVPTLNRNHIHQVGTKYPQNIPEQQAIARILSSFDDKIELLREQNETLEKTAQTIFQEWFGKYGTDDELPEGWRVEKLEELWWEIVRGFTTEYVEYSKLINLNQKVNKWTYLDKQFFKYYPEGSVVPKNKFARQYDILVNSLGEWTLWRIHLYCEETNNVVVDQHITILRFDQSLAFYIYQILTSKEGRSKLMSSISGSTWMTMLNISKIRDYLIVIPPRTDLINFSEMIVSLCQKIENNNSQIQSLSKTRDELLPRLMSGEVRLGHLNSRS